jgi:hypothetical protein
VLRSERVRKRHQISDSTPSVEILDWSTGIIGPPTRYPTVHKSMVNMYTPCDDFGVSGADLDYCLCYFVDGRCTYCMERDILMIDNSLDASDGVHSPQPSDQTMNNITDGAIFSEPEVMFEEGITKHSPRHRASQTPPSLSLMYPVGSMPTYHSTRSSYDSHKDANDSGQHLANRTPFAKLAPNLTGYMQCNESNSYVDTSPPSRSSTEDKPSKCDFCNENFTKKRNLARHQEFSCRKRKKDSVPVRCQRCDKEFTRPDALAKHMMNVHKRCCVCDEKFDSIEEVAKHKPSHSPVRKRSSESSR